MDLSEHVGRMTPKLLHMTYEEWQIYRNANDNYRQDFVVVDMPSYPDHPLSYWAGICMWVKKDSFWRMAYKRLKGTEYEEECLAELLIAQ